MICLEEQQDEFDFKFQTHKMEGNHIKVMFIFACYSLTIMIFSGNKEIMRLESQLHMLFLFWSVSWKL